jgi:M-phase inducer tyrosine phosphatase
MFEHPDDVMQQEDDSGFPQSATVQPVNDIDAGPTLHLPHFIPDDQPDSLPRIEKSILIDVLNGKYNDRYENIVIIDCRFEYEYEGGHINGAVNYNDKEFLAAKLFQEDIKPNTILVFHCEYSAHRAPIM